MNSARLFVDRVADSGGDHRNPGCDSHPAYMDHIARGRIAQGVEALSEAKVRMEQVSTPDGPTSLMAIAQT
jgi:hypothetical protein